MRSLRKGLKRLTRWAIAIALLPLVWVLARQVADMAPTLGREGVGNLWLYGVGAVGYLLVERIFARPMWLYVFGHELTHAVTGLMSGAKIHSFKAGSNGGEVHLSKTNAFIALSPYIVPLYAVFVVLIYAAAKVWWHHPLLLPTFQVLLGITVAFHFSLTFSALHSKQTDLKVMGFFLSGVLIAAGNLLILALLGIGLFQKTPSLQQFGLETTQNTLKIWMRGLRMVAAEVQRFNTPPQAGSARQKDTAWTR